MIAITALAVPAQAVAKKAPHYTGTVEQPQPADNPYLKAPAVDFWVKLKRGKPNSIPRLIFWNVYENCSDGHTDGPGHGSLYQTKFDVYADLDLSTPYGWPPVKKGKFSFTAFDQAHEQGVTVKGAIPRHGPATGTLSLFAHFPAVDNPPDPPIPAKDCSSGPLRWTANRTSSQQTAYR
jgi:hypothetical protein